MQTVAIPQIAERLQHLSADKLAVIYDFVSYLAELEKKHAIRDRLSEAYRTMLASEQVLRRDWDQPEEDAAWENL